MTPQNNGPYITAFFVCQRLDIEPNGAVAARGIQNVITIRSGPPELPPGLTVNPHIFIRFETGGHGKQQ